jgi:hypothetical protein
MNPRIATVVTMILVLLAAAASAGEIRRTTLQVDGPGQRVHGGLLADVDGDGDRDLVLSAGSVREGHEYNRFLHVHLRTKGEVAFGANPDNTIPVDRWVVAFSLGDVLPSPGREILLFSARGVYAIPALGAAKARERPTRVVESEVLWQLPDPTRVHTLPLAVRDLDGDGRDDLLIPRPGGYTAAFTVPREEGGVVHLERSLDLPDAPGALKPVARGARRMQGREQLRNLELGISIGGDDGAAGSLLKVEEQVPFPILDDHDGDGRADLLALSGNRLLVWPQIAGRMFGVREEIEFPLAIDEGRRLDVSFGTYAADIDGDGRTDVVILAGDRRSEEIRTQILVYRQSNGHIFGEKGRPTQVLIVRGFAGSVALTDADGDGDPDLVFATFDLQSGGALGMLGGGDVALSFRVHLNDKGTFSRQPDLELPLKVAPDDLRSGDRGPTLTFIPDISGDRLPDLLLRHDPGTLEIREVRRTGRGILTRDFYKMNIYDRAQISVETGDSGSEILVIERKQIHHLRYEP